MLLALRCRRVRSFLHFSDAGAACPNCRSPLYRRGCSSYARACPSRSRRYPGTTCQNASYPCSGLPNFIRLPLPRGCYYIGFSGIRVISRPSAQSIPLPRPARAPGDTRYMCPAHTASWVFDIVTTQVIIISPSYCNVVVTVAWIGIPHVEMIREVESRTCIEMRVGVIIPGPPRIISLVSCDHPDAGQIGVGLDLNVFHINALPAFSYHVKLHHSIDHVISD